MHVLLARQDHPLAPKSLLPNPFAAPPHRPNEPLGLRNPRPNLPRHHRPTAHEQGRTLVSHKELQHRRRRQAHQELLHASKEQFRRQHHHAVSSACPTLSS
jgi:hypothetical protein